MGHTQKRTDIRQVLRDAVARLEAAVRQAPEQWLWYHDRWKQLRLKNEE